MKTKKELNATQIHSKINPRNKRPEQRFEKRANIYKAKSATYMCLSKECKLKDEYICKMLDLKMNDINYAFTFPKEFFSLIDVEKMATYLSILDKFDNHFEALEFILQDFKLFVSPKGMRPWQKNIRAIDFVKYAYERDERRIFKNRRTHGRPKGAQIIEMLNSDPRFRDV